ncbi:MAG: sigma-70 family RNA polymerase sigma factor, partial [Bacilli bacterium]|nr:sigma-70 family RNA polymerase sigma factor [Bacilli bacterium]
LQRTFIKLYRNIDKFNSSDENVKKWLFRVAINDSKNMLKSMWRMKKVNLEDYDNIASVDKDKNNLLKSLNYVGIKYRVPLYLYYFEGYNIKEIAELMNLSESGIKSRLKRGKEKLKKEME